MAITNYPAGMLDNIGFVAVLTNYKGKWVYCWHKRRKSFEHPGGHVEPGETPMQAAKRELYEESGIMNTYGRTTQDGITAGFFTRRSIRWGNCRKVK